MIVKSSKLINELELVLFFIISLNIREIYFSRYSYSDPAEVTNIGYACN